MYPTSVKWETHSKYILLTTKSGLSRRVILVYTTLTSAIYVVLIFLAMPMRLLTRLHQINLNVQTATTYNLLTHAKCKVIYAIQAINNAKKCYSVTVHKTVLQPKQMQSPLKIYLVPASKFKKENHPAQNLPMSSPTI